MVSKNVEIVKFPEYITKLKKDLKNVQMNKNIEDKKAGKEKEEED